MALQTFEMGGGYGDTKYGQPTGYGQGAGIDPNLLRLLAERKRKQGIAGPMAPPQQQAPQASPGVQPQTAPMNPRLRAALLLRQRRRQQVQQPQAPAYGQAYRG